MNLNILLIILIPFFGTTLGSSFVYLLKNNLNPKIEKLLLSFSAGVMLAASIFSLILPALDCSETLYPVVIGLTLGLISLILINKYTSKITTNNKYLLMLAITIHNIPEGMAVGVITAGLTANTGVSIAAAFAVSMGIAIQNIPEGTIISLPLKCAGHSKNKAFILGMLSGIVEPLAALITIYLTNMVMPFFPYLLLFAAGTMIYVTIKELIPESIHDDTNACSFFLGFIIMLLLDILLG